MKKIIPVLLAFLIIVVFTAGCIAQTQSMQSSKDTNIILQIGNPIMMVNGGEKEIDPGRGTVPVVEKGRTLLPVRAVVEAMGGAVTWEEETQTTVLAKGETIILLTVGSKIAFLNEGRHVLDIEPVVQNGRIMLPIRFIAEGFGYRVSWNGNTQAVTLTPDETMPDENGAANGPDDTNKTDYQESNSIVVYFSQTGTTRALALKIAEITGSDLYEIIPEAPYTTEDLDYSNNNSRANREQNDSLARPGIAGETAGLAKYDTIYLGYPIWWGTNPRIINTFMDRYDLTGKTVMPFCSSHSSGISSSVSAIRKYCPNADVKEGLRGTAQTSGDEIDSWLLENEIKK